LLPAAGFAFKRHLPSRLQLEVQLLTQLTQLTQSTVAAFRVSTKVVATLTMTYKTLRMLPAAAQNVSLALSCLDWWRC
jgi:hypothetical protein